MRMRRILEKLGFLDRKEQWVHVKMFISDNVKYGGEPGKVYTHFYESDLGSRRVEYKSSFQDLPQKMLESHMLSTDLYNTTIARWLSGRYDPDIPRYSQIGEEDTANALRGKVG